MLMKAHIPLFQKLKELRVKIRLAASSAVDECGSAA
jgi:hypothetical protein